MAEFKQYARGPKEKPKQYARESRTLLQNQLTATENKLKKLAGKTDDESTRERRKLKVLARKLATKLGTMNPPDKEFP